MYKILTSSRGSDDLPIGFYRSRDRRQGELTNNKEIKGKYHTRFYLQDVFGFGEHQETGTFGLDYKLTMTRNTDNTVVTKDNAIKYAEIRINAIEWFVPHYTVSLEEYNKLMNQIVKKTPTERNFPERSVFLKEVKTQIFWTLELGVQEGFNVPIWIFVVFQRIDRQHDQNLNNDAFYRMPITFAQVVIGSQTNPNFAVLLNYNNDCYSQGYGQIKEAFKAVTKDNILQRYIGEDDFRSSNDGDNIGYNIHSFDIRYQKSFEKGQSVRVEFIFSENIPAWIYGYALLLPNKLVSISSDGQRMLDLL